MVLPIDNPTKSYWIEAAGSSLKNFRSSEELPQNVDVVIIGSGYTGTTTAYWINKYTEGNGNTPQMLMLEARDICGGATGRNGGQLRPHAYSRYPMWNEQFGPDGALELIKHEMAHLSAFKELLDEEGIAEEVGFKLGDTFDAAMTLEAWTRLKGAYDTMREDHGEDGDVVRECRLIEDPKAAEEFTQMKGVIGAVVHPAGQIWPYKFVHALLQKLVKTGFLNLQANTAAQRISKRDPEGWITVETPRGSIRTKTVVHATNRWASHLLPDFENLIYANRGTIAAIKAPEGFIKHTGAQHWDSLVHNYHIQLPPPHNIIIIGGAKSVLVHNPRTFIRNDNEDKQFGMVPEFYQSWPASDVAGWQGDEPVELGKSVDEGGVWTGAVMSSSIDSFPFVGKLPEQEGQFIAAGFTGHGMPRILLSTAHITPLILSWLGIAYTPPVLVVPYPELPKPFVVSEERMKRLQMVDSDCKFKENIRTNLESARKPFCNDGVILSKLASLEI